MITKTQLRYQRVLIKFSGEALLGDKKHGIDSEVVTAIAQEIRPLIIAGVEIGIVIGGGNFFRGAKLNQAAITRVTADQLGMVATILNALAMRDIFNYFSIPTKIMSALAVDGIVERYNHMQAASYLAQKFVVVFAGGTGNPFVTTDTALGLRGVELQAELLLKATNVDGVYDDDPQKNPAAKLYHRLTYQEVLVKELAVMDLSAFCLCRDHKKKLIVFNLHKKGALARIIRGEAEGTLVE